MMDSSFFVRRTATEGITDQSVLEKLVFGDASGDVRVAALAHLTDAVAIAKVAIDDADISVRRAPVARVTDPLVLAMLITHDASSYVRADALMRLGKLPMVDESPWETLVERGEDHRVRAIAATRLMSLYSGDRDLLGRLTTAAADASLRNQAAQKLDELKDKPAGTMP